MDIKEMLKNKKLILDGSTYTTFTKYGINRENTAILDVLCITDEELVATVHKRYIDAGADIISTNSFNSNDYYLKEKNCPYTAYELSKKAGLIAKKTALSSDKKIFVAGSVGPGNIALSQNADKIFELKNSYKENIRGLLDAYVDFILLETFYDAKNLETALAAVEELQKHQKFFVALALTIDKNGKIFSGEYAYDILKHLNQEYIFALGFNCSFGIEAMEDSLKKIATLNKNIIFYPNNMDTDIANFEKIYKKYLSKYRINIAGTCCGTDENYTKILKKIIGDAYE